MTLIFLRPIQPYCTNNFSDNEIIMGGDFNVVLNGDMDKLNSPQHKNKLAHREITNQMEMFGLSDVFPELHPSIGVARIFNWGRGD